jgi:hypothetical protein
MYAYLCLNCGTLRKGDEDRVHKNTCEICEGDMLSSVGGLDEMPPVNQKVQQV